MSFMTHDKLRTLTYNEFCDCFGLSHEGIIGNDEEVNTKIMGVLQSISSHRNTNYINKNISTI
jgi:hypothetical protein